MGNCIRIEEQKEDDFRRNRDPSIISEYRIQKSVVGNMETEQLRNQVKINTSERAKASITGFLKGGAIGAKYINGKDKMTPD